MHVLSSHMDIEDLGMSVNTLCHVVKTPEYLLLEPQKGKFKNAVLCRRSTFLLVGACLSTANSRLFVEMISDGFRFRW